MLSYKCVAKSQSRGLGKRPASANRILINMSVTVTKEGQAVPAFVKAFDDQAHAEV
jgi:hypothetical protein